MHIALKNADALLKKIMTEVDTNRDGKIQYEGTLRALQLWWRMVRAFGRCTCACTAEHASHALPDLLRTATDGIPPAFAEFRVFVRKAEGQLFDLFQSIDRDGNGKLDKAELQTAFKAAGLTVSNRRLHNFFSDMDQNNDGYVTFDEWR